MGLSHGKNGGKLEGNNSPFKKINARVDRVSIDGLARTKDDFVINAIEELFNVNNFEQLMLKSHAVKNKLEGLGCFQTIGIKVDTSSGPKATPDYGYEVTFTVRELKHINAGVQTMVGTNNEPHVVGYLKAPNILGRGEKCEGELSYGTKQTQNWNVTLSKPVIPKYNARVSTSMFAHNQNWEMSKYKLGESGIVLDFDLYSLKNLKHTFQWEGVIRDLKVGNRYTNMDIREHAGSTLKSSIKHILTYDTRKSVLFPSSGILTKLITEFAGVGGNVGFVKNEALLRLDVPLFTDDIVVQGSLGGGVMWPSQSNKGIVVCDHFFLGGPVTFRGFDLRGVGPSSDGCSMGGKAYWCASLNLFTPLPFRPSAGGFGEYFRTQFFANVGNVGDFSLASGKQSLTEQARFAYGIGLALRLGNMARVEVNYCFPVWRQEGDKSHHGVQIGLGTSL